MWILAKLLIPLGVVPRFSLISKHKWNYFWQFFDRIRIKDCQLKKHNKCLKKIFIDLLVEDHKKRATREDEEEAAGAKQAIWYSWCIHCWISSKSILIWTSLGGNAIKNPYTVAPRFPDIRISKHGKGALIISRVRILSHIRYPDIFVRILRHIIVFFI